jgi:RNA polymerase sigma-70 factor (ECF subfamily)
VTSALKRARAALERHRKSSSPGEPAPPPHSAAEQDLVARLTRAFETADVDGVVALLTEDAWLTMPPLPLEYQGRDLAGQFLRVTAFRPGWTARLIQARANGQPAFGFYARDPETGVFRTIGLMVITLSGTRVSAMTRFDPGVLPRFGLPATLLPRLPLQPVAQVQRGPGERGVRFTGGVDGNQGRRPRSRGPCAVPSAHRR